MEDIEYAGIDEVDSMQKVVLNKLSKEYYDKIKIGVHNELRLHIHIKKHSKSGSKAKWEIHVHAIAPTKTIISDKASDYDFSKTLHKAFKDIEIQLEKKFKNN